MVVLIIVDVSSIDKVVKIGYQQLVKTPYTAGIFMCWRIIKMEKFLVPLKSTLCKSTKNENNVNAESSAAICNENTDSQNSSNENIKSARRRKFSPRNYE